MQKQIQRQVHHTLIAQLQIKVEIHIYKYKRRHITHKQSHLTATSRPCIPTHNVIILTSLRKYMHKSSDVYKQTNKIHTQSEIITLKNTHAIESSTLRSTHFRLGNYKYK